MFLRRTIRLRPAAASWRRFYSSTHTFLPVDVLENINAQELDTQKPVILRGRFTDIPAISKWFTPRPSTPGARVLNESYLQPHSATLVPLELTRLAETRDRVASFDTIVAPLSVLIEYMTRGSSEDGLTRMYLAQCPLEDLPAPLRSDLPLPSLISQIGRGDVYGSSLWAGLPPTVTSLHRDPNPNLFVQLAGRKVVRLMTPAEGRALYMRARSGAGQANMRGAEMMVGDENRRLEEAVWDNGGEEVGRCGWRGWEAVLESGDALFIPLGWWHSVRGVGEGVNTSVNWWFR